MESVPFPEHARHTDREIYFSSLLIDEIENENVDEVKWLLLDKNADPNLVLPNHGVSPMHVLAGFENECFSVEIIEIALEKRGADPNVRSVDGLTPVHVAAIWGRCAVLEILLNFGGDPFLLEYKWSLNAEDLALKEHQWQTHAILATFSVFNDSDKHDGHSDVYLNGSSYKPTNENIEQLDGLSKVTLTNKSSYSKDYLLDGGDLLTSKPQVVNTNNMSLGETTGTLNCDGNDHFDREYTKIEQHNKIRKKKLSNQFVESFAKLKNFFGRASMPKLSSGNSPKVVSRLNGSKMSI